MLAPVFMVGGLNSDDDVLPYRGIRSLTSPIGKPEEGAFDMEEKMLLNIDSDVCCILSIIGIEFTWASAVGNNKLVGKDSFRPSIGGS